MHPRPDAARQTDCERNRRATLRTRMVESSELLHAASQAEGICPVWFVEHLSDRAWART